MAWEIIYSEQFEAWWHTLTQPQQDALTARLQLLQEHGPTLGRPTVDRIKGSALQNLKELRASKGGALRVLFVFDPRSRAVLLVGGDKSGQWDRWYDEMIPVAEALYQEHLREEGLI